MKVLVLGANGFIAREIITQLLQHKHEVVAAVRSRANLFVNSAVEIIQFDFTQSFDETIVQGVDVLINCVGVFQVPDNAMWQIHYHGPKKLYDACEKYGVKQIIHISALGIDHVKTPYAESKLAIEIALQQSKLDSVILRPSLVYGATSYGGSSLFRGLVSLPFVLITSGKAQQKMQPIYIQDLAKSVVKLLNYPGKHILPAVGEEQLSLRNILLTLRKWLGFPTPKVISAPLRILKLLSCVTGWRRNSPLSITAIKMMQCDNVAAKADYTNMINAIGFTPVGFTQQLQNMVSGVQDRWHARLVLLRPLLRWSIALVWLYTGIISIITANQFGIPLLIQAGFSLAFAKPLLYSGALIDFILGLMTLFNYRLRLALIFQCIIMLVYTVIISALLPMFWLHPFGPVLKNIPMFVATLIMLSLESDR